MINEAGNIDLFQGLGNEKAVLWASCENRVQYAFFGVGIWLELADRTIYRSYTYSS